MSRLVIAAPLLALLTLATDVNAQSISTVAGGGTDDGRPATLTSLYQPWGVAVDATGNLFIADTFHNRIRKVSSGSGIISTVAGNGSPGFSGDGGAATAAALTSPKCVAVDAAGNLFIADYRRIRKVFAGSGIISTVAGNGSEGFSGDGGAATAAALFGPHGIVVDDAGNLFFADHYNNRIRKVAAGSGIISTLAGNGSGDFSGDGGAATAAALHYPSGVALDAAGNLFIADSFNHRIRRVAAGSGMISTMAGNGSQGFSGDGGAATAAGLWRPQGIAVDPAGNLLIADIGSYRIRKVAADSGLVSTVAGNGWRNAGGDNGPATAAGLVDPTDIAVDAAGNLFIAEGNRIRRVLSASGTISTFAGNFSPGFIGDGGAATAAGLSSPQDVAVDAAGNLFIVELGTNRIRKVVAGSGIISTVAGSGNPNVSGDGGAATAAGLLLPQGVAVDAAGNLFIAEGTRIRKVSAGSGIITTVAGNGSRGFSGDGGAATAAGLYPQDVAVDAAGNLFIADTDNGRIRKVSAGSGIITTVAGNGNQGFDGDGGAATAAQLAYPESVAADAAGNLFIAEPQGDRIRKVSAGSGIITTVAGNLDLHHSFSGDGGPATAAGLYSPTGIEVDAAGNLFIADNGNQRIRKVSAGSGIITTVAGNGTLGGSGDGGPATAAELFIPVRIAVDAAGNLFITTNDRVRAVYACVVVGGPSLTLPSQGSSGVATAPLLSWDPVKGAFRYDVYLGPDPSARTLAAADVAATSFSPSNLEPNTTYYWRVVAKGDPFCDPFHTAESEVRSFTTASGCRRPAGFEGESP